MYLKNSKFPFTHKDKGIEISGNMHNYKIYASLCKYVKREGIYVKLHIPYCVLKFEVWRVNFEWINKLIKAIY